MPRGRGRWWLGWRYIGRWESGWKETLRQGKEEGVVDDRGGGKGRWRREGGREGG